jgi:hypothetical protein
MIGTVPSHHIAVQESAVGTKLPNRDVSSTFAIGVKPT